MVMSREAEKNKEGQTAVPLNKAALSLYSQRPLHIQLAKNFMF